MKVLPVFNLHRIERETFVRQVLFRCVLRSTNDRAVQLAARANLHLPMRVLAERQTAGRGRGTNQWWSARGSLTFSLLLDADPLRVRSERWPQISLTAAAAVCEIIEDICPDSRCGIRWPNDVYVAGRKVCGILPEVVPARDSIPTRLVVGIGINVNNTLTDAPPDVLARGSSLFDLTGTRYDMTEVLVRVLNRLEFRLGQLTRRDARLAAAWSARCLLRSRTVELSLGTRRVRGSCQGMDHAGALLLTIGKRTMRYFSGVIAAVE
jgi:BirA family transcriptional regulator, biotin operon repressor / biotin---[acetyl-CoA-carboxylase] ligase